MAEQKKYIDIFQPLGELNKQINILEQKIVECDNKRILQVNDKINSLLNGISHYIDKYEVSFDQRSEYLKLSTKFKNLQTQFDSCRCYP